MSCNSCAKSFTLLRKEKGCPNCGFSYCSKCLESKIFVQKLSKEAKVCIKCKNAADKKSTKPNTVEPPDAYYKRLGQMSDEAPSTPSTTNKQSDAHTQVKDKDQEILSRLQKLKEDSRTAGASEQEIAERLRKIKGDVPKTSDEELQQRLARLRGVPVSVIQSPASLPPPDRRTAEEQANDLLKQYADQNQMDARYNDQFDALVRDIESRLSNLKGEREKDKRSEQGENKAKGSEKGVEMESEDEEEAVRKIVEKIKSESSHEPEEFPSTADELPFCEICNEDATMRCLGCRYLFCKRCFSEHKDDDDGCDRYEPYTPPKGSS